MSQRDRFYALVNEALRNDERVEVVLAEIGAERFPTTRASTTSAFASS